MSNQRVTGDLPIVEAKIDAAATWLVGHREECTGRIIPTLKQRFGLTICEAISAAQIAHARQYGEVRHG